VRGEFGDVKGISLAPGLPRSALIENNQQCPLFGFRFGMEPSAIRSPKVLTTLRANSDVWIKSLLRPSSRISLVERQPRACKSLHALRCDGSELATTHGTASELWTRTYFSRREPTSPSASSMARPDVVHPAISEVTCPARRCWSSVIKAFITGWFLLAITKSFSSKSIFGGLSVWGLGDHWTSTPTLS
jgi:hypothetical protein